jgi:hypothetical protein
MSAIRGVGSSVSTVVFDDPLMEAQRLAIEESKEDQNVARNERRAAQAERDHHFNRSIDEERASATARLVSGLAGGAMKIGQGASTVAHAIASQQASNARADREHSASVRSASATAATSNSSEQQSAATTANGNLSGQQTAATAANRSQSAQQTAATAANGNPSAQRMSAAQELQMIQDEHRLNQVAINAERHANNSRAASEMLGGMSELATSSLNFVADAHRVAGKQAEREMDRARERAEDARERSQSAGEAAGRMLNRAEEMARAQRQAEDQRIANMRG